jgi:CO/xanthine dehydrogenase FAD-binding subunit
VKSFVPVYDLRAPENLSAALDLLEREPGTWRPLAGGTDLMVLFESGKLSHRKFFSIWHLRELRGLEVSPTHVTLGALTTYARVQRELLLQSEFPLLCLAARETGSIATQNRGTLGGNIANASPAADSPPALLVYDAELELVSARGPRWVPYHGFYAGYKQMDLRPDELLKAIRLPRTKKEWRHYYRKVGPRKAQAISKVCLAGTAKLADGKIADIRIALGSVAPIPLRCVKTEEALRNQVPERSIIAAAKQSLSREISPIDDIRSTAAYRLQVAQNLLEEFLLSLG